MKGIFYLLLLLNLGFFGWQFLVNEDNAISQSISQAMSNDRGNLMLLSELSEADKMKLSKNPEKYRDQAGGTRDQSSRSSQDKDTVCYQAGPFVSKQARSSFASKVSAYDMDVDKQWQGHEDAVRYWVYLPPLRSQAEARSVIANLKRKGITDVAVVGSGEFKNAVSLGLFGSRENARERVALLQKHAYTPKINESTVSKTNYWLSFSAGSAISSSRQSRLLRDFSPAQIQQTKCK